MTGRLPDPFGLRQNRSWHRLVFGAALVVAATGASLQPANAEVTRCDELAADIWDPLAVTDGVEFWDIDAATAKVACNEAIRQFPGKPRFKYQQFFVLTLLREKRDARAHLKAAAEVGYPSALYWMVKEAERDAFSEDAGLDLQALPIKLHRKTIRSYLTAAAEAGDPRAQVELGGLILEEGQDFDDYDLGIDWYERAFAAGYAEASIALGYVYSNGRFAPRDFELAQRYFRTAADMSDMEGHLALFRLYGEGPEQVRDKDKAIEHLRLAEAGGSSQGRLQLALELAKGELVEPDLAESQALACRLHWLDRGVYRRLHKSPLDCSATIEALAESAASGDFHATYRLAEEFVVGEIVEKDLEKARDLACRLVPFDRSFIESNHSVSFDCP